MRRGVCIAVVVVRCAAEILQCMGGVSRVVEALPRSVGGTSRVDEAPPPNLLLRVCALG